MSVKFAKVKVGNKFGILKTSGFWIFKRAVFLSMYSSSEWGKGDVSQIDAYCLTSDEKRIDATLELLDAMELYL